MDRGPQEGKARNRGIDLFRGTLAILVILGHFSELTDRQTFATWLGFGFRMPLFIGVTGYLFPLESARAASFAALFRRYYSRLILPWVIACLVYLILAEPVSLAWLAEILVRPPFHLWFVPVTVVFVVAAWACPLSPGRMLAIAAPASIVAMYVFGVGYAIEQYHPWVPDRRYFIYPIYFCFGLWVARRPLQPERIPLRLLLSGIGLVWWCALYDNPAPAAEVAAELMLCMPLIRLLPLVRRIGLSLPPVATIGRDSLFFYLWHPLVFGLWAAAGYEGLPMLVLTFLTLGVAWATIVRLPSLRSCLGIGTPQGPSPSRPASGMPAAPAG